MNSNQNNYNQGQQQRPTQNYRPTQQPKQAQSRQPQQAQGVNPQTQQYAQPQQRQQTYGVREQKYTQPPQQRQQYAQSGQYTQPQQYAPQQYTQEQQYQNSQADARYSNIMENLDVLHSGNLAEERARKKGRRVAGVILGLAALTAVAVPVTIIGSKAMENAEYEVQVNTEFSDTQTYSVSLKKGSTIAQLKTKLNIIPGYSLEGVYKDAAFTQAYADNEKVSASSQVYLKYEKETYILSLPTEQEQANNHYEIKYVQSVNLEKIEWGSSFVFQIVPKDGYELNANTTVTAGGQTLTGDENGYYTVSSIERNTSITISGISAKTYNFVQEGQDISSFPAGITVTKNGSVITSPTELSYGDNLKISYTVQEGYEKTKFIVNGTEYYTANEANITVTSDIEIEFEQQIKTYSVNMPESLAGKYNVQIVSVVDKDGEPIANFNGIVPHGGRIHFKVEMEEGYKIPTITLNNKNVGIEYDEEEGEYIATITTSSAIQVQGIAVQTYDIIFKDDEGNTISSQTVEHGKSAITNINYAKAPTVSTQYEFLGWKLVDASGSDISGGEYVTDFTQIKASMILQAVYKESVREYELNYRLGDGCSSMLIRVNGEEATSIYTIKYGDKITVEANPNIADGYTSTEIKINDNDYDGEYSVEENVYIVATGVKEGKCGISLVQGNGYKISLVGSSDTSVDAGTTVKIKVETLDAYEETKDFLVKNNGTIIGTSAGEYEVTINQNTEITVEGVELKEFTLGTIPNNVKVKRTKTDKEGASIDTYLSSGETIYYGDILSISAEVTEGYKEPIITINGNAYTQPIEVKSNISVGYQETLITQTIKLVGGAGYSFAPQWAEEDVVTDVDGVTTVSNVPIIKDFYFTLILAEGYSLNNSNISVEGATITEVAVNQYKVSGFTTDLNITLPSDMVKVNQYKVISPVSNAYTFDFGSLDDNGNDWLVNYGDDVEFTFTFNEDGYKMAEGSEVSLSVTGATLEHDEETGKYTLKDVNGTVFIVVNGNIEINKYSVTLPETQTGYTLTADKDSVKYKDSVTFTLELNAEYSNSNFSLVIDGVTYTKSQFTPISSTNIYTLTIDEVTKNLQSINVEGLVQNSYTITLPSTQTGYTLTADTSVVHGGSAIITITLDDKYSNSDFSVKIGGSTYSKSAFEFDNNKYTLELINITSNLSIELAGELTANTYSITLPQTQTGYQLSANKSTVTHGEGLIVEFNLLEGYTQSENLAISVISKGKTLTTITKSMLTDGAISYTLPEAVEGVGGVIADVEIAVTGVELNTYDVDVNYGKGIKSATLSKDSVIHDGNTTLTIVLEENYLEDKDNLIVKIGNSEIPLSGLTALNNTVYTYTLQKVQDHTTIEIGDLSENTYDVTLPSTTLETEGYTLIANKTAGVKHGEEITLTLILADTHATANFVVKIGHDEYDRTDFIQNAENNNIYTKTITITNDITASVTLDLTYTVTFKSADGTSTLSTQKIEHNQYAVEPKAPTKARDDENNIEYEFVGWSTTLGGDVVEDIDSTSVTENVTYFAKFIEVYTVTFMNGNEVFATQKVRNGDTITSISAPTKADESGVRYAFDYWQDEAGNDATSAVAQAVSANATYTAQFIESEYLVSFVHNGTTYATQWVESGEVIDEDALTLSSTPSKSSDSIYNYIHDGWSATDDGSLIDLSTQIINDVTTYYAHFDEEYIEYDITTNTSETGLEIVVYDSNSDEEVTSVHYGHNYYFTCSGGDAYTTYVNGSQVSANAEFTAYGNIIIQAIENAKEVHLVQFVDEADNILASQAVVEGQAPTAPSEPTKPSDNTYNYTFSHWQASDGSEVTDWSTQTIIGDTDYTAVFDAEYIEYDIDIKKPDGVEFDMSIFDSNNDYVGTVRYGNKYHIVFVNYPTKDCVFYLNGEEIKEDDEFTAYGDIIIQAIEVAETHHTVTFRYNDENGEAKTITQSVLEGDVVVAPYVIDNYNTIDTKYTFIGWSVTPNDTENAVKDLNSTIDRDGIVYYGVYIESQYLVTFENNGEIVATQWVDADGYATVPSQTLKAPTSEDERIYEYVFAGWGTSEDEVHEDYNIDVSSTPIIGPTTIYAHWGKSEIQHTLTITAPKGATITINGEQTVTNGKLEIFRGYLDGYNITINAEDGYVLTSYRDEGWNIIECETVEQMQSVSLSVAATGDANIECWVVEAATVTVDGLTDTSFVIPVDKNVYNYIRDNYKKILNIFSSESEHSIDEYTCGLYLDEGLQTPLGENITGEQFKAMGIKTLYTKQVTLYYDNNAEMLLEITINDNKNPTYAIAVIKSRIDGVNVVVPKSYKTKINGTDYTLPVQQVTFSNAYSALRTKISSIIIPSTVTSISFTYEQDGNNDVYNSLTSIIVVGDNPIYDSRDNCNAIIETATNTLIRGSNFTVIPDTVTTLGEYCFAGADISKPSKEGQWAGDGHGYTIPYSVSFIDLGAYMNVITSGGGGFYEYIDETQWTYASSNSSTTWTELQSSQSLFIISANNYLRKKNTTTLSATFELNADGQSYTLVECKDTTSTHIIVPAIYNGKPVTKIGSYAFNGNTTVQTVTLPLTIQEIGDSAFEGCTNLTNINLPNGLTTIGRAAFKWAGLSGELKIPASVVSIGAHAFSQVVVGYDEKGLESSWELYKDSNSNVVGKITSLIFEENAKCEFIGQRAFGWCASITNIALPSSLKHIEVGAFHCCTGLKTFSFGENSKLEYIAKNAFNSCRYIDDEGELQPTAGLDISNLQNLKYIGEKAFQNTYITSFTIPQNVEHIDIDAFRTTKLTNLSVNSNSRYFSSKSTMVKNDGDSVESIIVNSNKTSGECNAIWGYINGDWTIVAGSANTANLPAGIQSIGNSAFREIAITILTLPGSVNNIEKNAFHTSGIQTLNIGGEVVVGDDAFNHCYDLSAIYYFANKIDISAFTGSNNNFIESHGTNTTFTFYALSTFKAPTTNFTIHKKGNAGGTNSAINVVYTEFDMDIDDGYNATVIKYNGTYAGSQCDESGTNASWGDWTRITGADDKYYKIFHSPIFGNGNINGYTVTAIGREYSLTDTTKPNYVIVNSDGSLNITAEGYGGSDGGREHAYASIFGDLSTISSTVNSIKSVTIPASVKTINHFAFAGLRNCNSLTFSTYTEGDKAGTSDLTTIGDYVFYGLATNYGTYTAQLSSITLPEGLTTIGKYAFAEGAGNAAQNKFVVTLPNSLKDISDYAFYSTLISSIMLNDNNNLTTIGAYAFASSEYGNYSLKLPKLTDIGDYAFSVSGIQNITIGYNIMNIGNYAFASCIWLENVTFDGDFANSLSLKSENLGESIFENCRLLTSVIGLDYCSSLESLPANMFKGCSKLQTVALPASLKEFDYSVFAGCTSLINVTIGTWTNEGAIDKKYYDCNGVIIVDSTSGAVVFGCKGSSGNVEIPEWFYVDYTINITSIADHAFYGCTGLTSITIPGSVTEIGTSAFVGCTSLTSVTLNNGLKTIKSQAFYNCISLEEIELPASVESLDSWVFAECTSLASVTLNEGLKSIEYLTFQNCTQLTYISMPKTLKILGYGLFDGCSKLTVIEFQRTTSQGDLEFLSDEGAPTNLHSIWVPANSYDAYVSEFPNYSSYIQAMTYNVVNESAKTIEITGYIGTRADVIIPETYMGYTVVGIADGAFSGNTTLQTLTFDANSQLQYIGDYAFEGCTALTTIKLPDSLTTIGEYAFSDCDSLTTATSSNTGWCTYNTSTSKWVAATLNASNLISEPTVKRQWSCDSSVTGK